ncbi:MAG: FAD-dependent oxidoreductase [Solirubrobacterales bacterium]
MWGIAEEPFWPAAMTETIEADVAIVGAGLAGLVAARRIAAAGARPLVLEARDRVGQENAQRAWDERTDFRELLGAAAPDLDLDSVFDYDAYLAHVPGVMARLDELK